MAVDIQKEIADWEKIAAGQKAAAEVCETMFRGVDPRVFKELQENLGGALKSLTVAQAVNPDVGEMKLMLELNASAAGHLGLAVSYALATMLQRYAAKKIETFKSQLGS